MTEIDTRHLVALGAVAQNAIRAKKPPAFLNVSGGVSVLRQQDSRQRQQQRKWNQSHAYCLSWEIGSYGIAAGVRGQYRRAASSSGGVPPQPLPFSASIRLGGVSLYILYVHGGRMRIRGRKH